jgi:hypothetical protein
VTGRRLLILLVVLTAIAIPAGVLRAVCAGRSCEKTSDGSPRVPFCPLPAAIREGIEHGYREGRSPDVLGVAATPVFTAAEGSRLRESWPSPTAVDETLVPMVFWGTGTASGATVPDGTTLDRIAPTVSDAIGFDRPFPDVRSGTAIDGVAAGDRPRLVLLVAWKGIGSAELEASPAEWPFLASLLAEGAGTLGAQTGSLPLDPAAILTTIGTGGLPSQHGITGSFVRSDRGEVVPAFGDGAPVQVIATLADDLDEQTGGRALVGLVATDESDRGIVGGGWYPDEDPVDVAIGDGAAVPLSVDVHLSTGYGDDDVPDVIGVVMDGSIRSLDARTRRIVSAAERATGGSVLVVVAGTGGLERSPLAEPDSRLVRAVEEAVPGEARAVAATVPGGIFLDQAALTEAQATGQVAVDALLGVTDSEGREMMTDAFQGFAVSFARYC